jgi:hypothetical protein
VSSGIVSAAAGHIQCLAVVLLMLPWHSGQGQRQRLHICSHTALEFAVLPRNLLISPPPIPCGRSFRAAALSVPSGCWHPSTYLGYKPHVWCYLVQPVLVLLAPAASGRGARCTVMLWCHACWRRACWVLLGLVTMLEQHARVQLPTTPCLPRQDTAGTAC